MCTLNWLLHNKGYELYFNRDEKKTRLPASPPALFAEPGVTYMAPLDGNFEGTWMLVNELGVSICLLNHDRCESHGADDNLSYSSRGLLVKSLADVRTAQSVYGRLEAEDLSVYRPFFLFSIDLECEPQLLVWNGLELKVERGPSIAMPITTSSFCPDQVIPNRRPDLESKSYHRLCP